MREVFHLINNFYQLGLFKIKQCKKGPTQQQNKKQKNRLQGLLEKIKN